MRSFSLRLWGNFIMWKKMGGASHLTWKTKSALFSDATTSTRQTAALTHHSERARRDREGEPLTSWKLLIKNSNSDQGALKVRSFLEKISLISYWKKRYTMRRIVFKASG